MVKKIFINNNVLYLADELTNDLQVEKDEQGSIYLDELNESNVDLMLDKMDEGSASGIFIHKNLNELFDAFLNKMTIIKAGGGFVYNSNKEILMIYRRKKWDLPKGKLDENEKMEDCAVREVEEETGLSGVQLQNPLCFTHHTYLENGIRILKESHWFLMQVESEQVLIPQTDEDIEKCEWVKKENLNPYLDDTHLSIIDVVKKGVEALKEIKNV
jgi:8-oxo-dGTP pyrophosphatase MutT (NUDIX family)